MKLILCAIWLSFATFFCWLSATLNMNTISQLLIDIGLNDDRKCFISPSSFTRQNGYAGTYPGRSLSASSAPSTPFNRFVSTGGSPTDSKPDR